MKWVKITFTHIHLQVYNFFLIYMDAHRHVPGDGSPEPEDLPGQEPLYQPDAVGGLVSAWDGNVHELEQKPKFFNLIKNSFN